MVKFAHLHTHTEFSLLDGAGKIGVILDKCKELGMDSMAITDHGVMYGVVDFYKEALKRDIRPVIGCEVYVAPRSMDDKQAHTDKEYAHLVLLAENNEGYHNLMKLVSLGFTRGFYYKPRIDYDILAQYHKGLIGLSACLSGDIPKLLLDGQYQKAMLLATRLEQIMGKNNFFIEIQDHGLPEQKRTNPQLIQISRETSIPLIATNDIHYIKKEDSEAHEVLLCVQTGKTMEDPQRLRFATSEFYIKSPVEMEQLFKEYPDALENTIKIAERCHVDFDFHTIHLPEYDVPEGKPHAQYLHELCDKGLKLKYTNITKEIQDRLEFELRTIEQMGYVDYFLIVWDFIKYAKDHQIMVGPGRGSAAGSIVAYTLDITGIDPLKYNLLFERFLNPDRISMPDIDIDFCFERRQEVIDYVIQKYGKDRVAQIITFGTMAARAAIRDVGRALNIPYAEVDQVAKMIPFELNMNIERALQISGELAQHREENDTIRKLLDTAQALEGLPRHASTHAAGIVISKMPIADYVPLQKNDENIVTQFSMNLLEQLGLLKMDFLGLRTLTVIRDALDLIKNSTGNRVELESLALDDPHIYEMLSLGDTDGVFQLESAGMKQFMKELKPSSFEDIIAGISLYRPGPMEQIPRYVEGKYHPETIHYAHPLLEPILQVTHGCMVYQEQVMQIVRDLGGYSLGRSDLVRRAMSKKKKDVMQKERAYFIHGLEENGKLIIPGAIRNGVPEQIANSIFDEMMAFAEYAFNKSHAAAYGVVAYWTAWLKYYYPVEYMAALMTSIMGNSSKIASYIQYCKKIGIPILPPDVNKSEPKFTVEGKSIRFGLVAVKNVGLNAILSILNIRQQKGEFIGFLDFCQKLDSETINKKLVESLIKSGAFDSMKVYRSQLMAVYEKTMEGVAQNRKRNIAGQVSLFDIEQPSVKAPAAVFETLPQIKEYSMKYMLSMEKEMTGVYISGHPLEEFKNELDVLSFHTSDLLSINQGDGTVGDGLTDITDGQIVTIGGIIVDKKIKATKNNKMMAFITIEDLYGAIEGIVFPTVYQRYAKHLEIDHMVIVKGKVSIREDEEPKILCEEIQPLQKAIMTKKLYLKISQGMDPGIYENIKPILKRYSGNVPVYVYWEEYKKKDLIDREYWITDTPSLFEELSDFLQRECVKMVG